jgi:hypothetical protein
MERGRTHLKLLGRLDGYSAIAYFPFLIRPRIVQGFAYRSRAQTPGIKKSASLSGRVIRLTHSRYGNPTTSKQARQHHTLATASADDRFYPASIAEVLGMVLQRFLLYPNISTTD